MTRRFPVLCAVVLTVVLGTAAPGFAYTPHELSYADGLDVSSMNPFISTSGNAVALAELTMAEFTRFGPHGEAIPELITELPTKANHGVSADGRTITWHLRHNVKWSDGQPFDASDVVYTYHVARDPANNLAVRDPWERLSGVDAPNPYTVVFHFKEPYALFITDYFSTLSTSCILPKHILGPGTAINDAPYNALPVGIGPFRYTAYHRGDDVVMEANPYYWRGKPKLQRITYKIITDDNTLFTQLETGELDLWDGINGVLAQRVKTLSSKSYETRLSNYMSAIFMNTQHPIVSDPVVRRALEFATNRAAVLDKVVLHNGIITQSVIPKTSVDAADLPLTPFDLARAAKLLDGDGWKKGPGGMRSKNGTPLTFDLAIPSGYAPSATLANILHDDWGSIGVNVQIHTYASSQFFAIYAAGGVIQTGKFDGALFSQALGPVYAAVNGVFDCAGIPPNGQNATRYCNHAVDKLDDAYIHSFDPAVRHTTAITMQKIINDDTPAIMLYERTFLSSYDARLHGYHPNSYSYWGDPLELDM
jgi:peptide/nickel transport system substrate-binding protein